MFHVELVSPEKILWSGDAEMVIARTTDGELGILTGHAPLIGALGVGPVRIRPAGGGAEVSIAVHGGFIEVRDDRVIILSDVAELAEQIDVDRARAALSGAGEDAVARRRAETRLQVAGAPVSR